MVFRNFIDTKVDILILAKWQGHVWIQEYLIRNLW